ncbi:alpha/beta hydrolase family esterase [Piscinibacter sakaiensis]|uniref:extracellular catalytic domain type 1 short-chain-length polyhydroxyalkanoate depolymerase n=1 Tax=Piscinibacter sakaiensis TaxID=1547922 RepID=UPI003AAB1531
MVKRIRSNPLATAWHRSLTTLTRQTMLASQRAVTQAVKSARKSASKPGSAAAAVKRLNPLLAPPAKPPRGAGDWLSGIAVGAAGMRRFRLYRPPGVKPTERLPLMVMLHGCSQDAAVFASSTRMNRIAARERFLVLYPEQDRLANPQGCWNWFDTDSRRAYGEAALILQAVDQACMLYPVDRNRIAVAGLSAGASMAALLASRHPERFKAVVMHSGIPPGTAHSSLSALGAMGGRRVTHAPAPRPLLLQQAPQAWPPLLVIHGQLDHVVSPRNGRAAAELWAATAGAKAGTPREVRRGERHPMTLTDFKRSGRTAVTLIEISRLGHAWSGGAANQAYGDGNGPDASRLAWSFAAKQFAAKQSSRIPARG